MSKILLQLEELGEIHVSPADSL